MFEAFLLTVKSLASCRCTLEHLLANPESQLPPATRLPVPNPARIELLGWTAFRKISRLAWDLAAAVDLLAPQVGLEPTTLRLTVRQSVSLVSVDFRLFLYQPEIQQVRECKKTPVSRSGANSRVFPPGLLNVC
jgi:hypothetical protein